MAEKLTWDEIKKLYPDEWVILVDVDVNATTDVTAGRVYDHNSNRDYIHDRQLDLAQDAAVLYTGEPRGSIIASLGFASVEIDE